MSVFQQYLYVHLMQVPCLILDSPVWKGVQVEHGHPVGVDGHHVDNDADNVQQEPNLQCSNENILYGINNFH